MPELDPDTDAAPTAPEAASAVALETDDRMTRRVLQVCDAAGEFIAWWGFRAIHGRVWTLLALRGVPMSQTAVAKTLGVSRSLTSTAMQELADYGLVRPVGAGRNAPWVAVVDVWPVITDVLRRREWMLLERARVSLEGAIEEAELAQGAGERLGWDLGRMRVLYGMTETAQGFLKMVVSLRVPSAVPPVAGFVERASTLLRRIRTMR